MKTYECPMCGDIAVPVYNTGDWVCICCSNCGSRTKWYGYIVNAEEEWKRKEKEDER